MTIHLYARYRTMNTEARTPGKFSLSISPRSAVASWILAGIALFLVLKLHLLSALLAGLLTHELVRLLAPLVEKRLTSKAARLVALAALAILTITLLILLTFGIFAFFKSDTGNRQALIDKTEHILSDARTKLPPWIIDNLPSDVDALKSFAGEWVDEHSKEIQQAGKEVVHFFVRGLVGMVIGALISLHEEVAGSRQMRPFAAALTLQHHPLRPCFPPNYLCPGENIRDQHHFHRHFSGRNPSCFRDSFASDKNAHSRYFSRRLAPGDRQSDFEHLHFYRGPFDFDLRGNRGPGLPGDHPQAGIFPQRKNCWHTNSGARVGNLAGHDCPRGGIRYRRAHCRPDLLRVHQERADGGGFGLAASPRVPQQEQN